MLSLNLIWLHEWIIFEKVNIGNKIIWWLIWHAQFVLTIAAIWAPWNLDIQNIEFAYIPNKSLFWVLLFLWFQQVFFRSISSSRMFHVLDPSPLGKFSTTLDHNLDNFLWCNPSHATLGIQALHKQSFAKSQWHLWKLIHCSNNLVLMLIMGKY